MRMGQEAGDFIDIPSRPGIRVIQVPLTEAEAQKGVIRGAALEVDDNVAGINARNRAAVESDVWHSLREPDNLEQKVFESVEEMSTELDSYDLDYLADNLMLLMDFASPALDGLDDATLEELKKAFGEIDWSALTGRRWAAVKLCVSTLFPELLQVKLRGSGSTASLTSKKENVEST